MNEKIGIWWIGGGGILVLAALVAFLFNEDDSSSGDPGRSGSAGSGDRWSSAGGESSADVREDASRRRQVLAPGSGKKTERVARSGERPLSRTANPATGQCLEALVRSPLEADRVKAAMLLGRRASEEGLARTAVPALITAMEVDENPQVWLASAQALGRFGADAAEAVPALMKWFDHPTMRDVAIDALGEIGPAAESAIDSVSPVALEQRERLISRRKAIEALVKIGGPGHPGVAAVLESASVTSTRPLTIAVQQALETRLGTQ